MDLIHDMLVLVRKHKRVSSIFSKIQRLTKPIFNRPFDESSIRVPENELEQFLELDLLSRKRADFG